MKRIFLKQPARLNSWEIGEADRISCEVADTAHPRNYVLVDSEKEADIIVVLESCSFKCHNDLDYYRELIELWTSERIALVLNYEDGPPGVLPGLYTSLEAHKFDRNIHLSWPHMRFPNERILDTGDACKLDYDYIFSFMGSCSHPLRREIFALYEHGSKKDGVFVQEVKRWYNHDENEKESYINKIKKSAFVLCPRGIASYTHRIIETLALGRVPVVVADDWVPFSIPERDYFIRISESDVGSIDKILTNEVFKYGELWKKSTVVYNKYFEQSRRYSIAFDRLVALSDRMPNYVNRDYLLTRLRSSEFYKMNGWLFSQRLRSLLKRRWRQLRG